MALQQVTTIGADNFVTIGLDPIHDKVPTIEPNNFVKIGWDPIQGHATTIGPDNFVTIGRGRRALGAHPEP